MIGPEIIQIDNTNGPDTDLEVIGPFGETPLDEWIAESEDEPGEWQGPLSPDTYAQGRVAGLRDAEVIAQFMVMATPSNVAAALRFMADKLEAQQAQEGGVGDAGDV
jgi:hypothetical protein